MADRKGIDMAPPKQSSSKLKFVKRDVRDANIKDDFVGCDSLVHLAFIVMPLRSEAEMDSINIDGTKNVFEAASNAGIKNVVYTSSVATLRLQDSGRSADETDFSLSPRAW